VRAFSAAAVQVPPISARLSRETAETNVAHCADMVRRCVADTEAELVVLPETCTTGFTPGLGPDELWALVDPVDGPLTAPLHLAAAELSVHLVYGAYEPGIAQGTVYNSAVLVGPDGSTKGVYRKTHPFCTELRSRGGWVTPGDDICVVETPLGRIGMIICFDGDFPELSRISALAGAEVIVRPSALLRSADIWELTNRARSYDNHVYLIGANAVGTDPAGVMYFGNSMIVTPIAEVVARAASHECWISARLDPERAMRSLTPGSSVSQSFDHLADRNLDLIARYADRFVAPAATSFPYRRPTGAGAPEERP
jgi:predicted amidohydrolase